MADIQKLNVNGNTYDISTTWEKVTGKPSTFTPSSHTHTFASLTSKPTTLAGYGITDTYTATTINNKLSGYLPLTGGTLNVGYGSLIIEGQGDNKLIFNNTDGEKYQRIIFKEANTEYGYILVRDTGVDIATPTLTVNEKNVLHSGNYNSYAPTLTGTGASGTWSINISGSAATATSATTATKLSSNAGSATNPIYFSGGKPVACTYSLNKTVPSNAVFTDTNTWRPVTNTYTGSDQSTCVSQYGTNALYNALVNGYASSAGTATYAANDVDGSPFKTTYLRKVTVANNTENNFNSFSNMTLTGRGDPTTGASLKNAPWTGGGPAGGYGVLTYLWGSYGTQMAWGYASNRIYIRNKYYIGSAPTWSSSWDSIALMSDIPTSLPASDVYSWAKASTKPTYTYSEVGAAAASHNHTRVLDIGNSTATTFAYSKPGLGYDDYSWLAGWNGYELRAVSKTQFAKASHGTHLSGSAALYSNSSSGSNCNNVTYNLIGYYTSNGPSTSLGASTNDGTLYSQAYSSSWVSQIAQDYRNGNLFTRGKNNGTWTAWKAVSYNGHTHTKSQITDFPSSMPASDVYSWAKASTKPTYTYSEVGAAAASHTHSYLPLSGGTLSGNLSLERYKLYWNGDINGSYISSNGMTKMIYDMREGHIFCTGGDERLSITRFGNVIIGNSTSTEYKLQVNGSANATTLYENGTRVALSGHTHSYLPLSGGTVSGTITATGFYQSSDERLKTFYDPIKIDFDKLSKLRKNYFKFNDKDKLEIGVSAQEIQSIYPEIVSTDDNGYLSVAYDKLSVIALAAIDELDNKYKKEINDLKDQLDAIKNILNEKGIV